MTTTNTSKTVKFLSVPLLIEEHIDSLITDIDVYTELFGDHKGNQFLPAEPKSKPLQIETKYKKCQDEKTWFDEFNEMYADRNYDKIEPIQIDPDFVPEKTKLVDYADSIRMRAVEELKKLKTMTLAYYKTKKDQFKVNRAEMNDEKIEDLKSRLFS